MVQAVCTEMHPPLHEPSRECGYGSMTLPVPTTAIPSRKANSTRIAAPLHSTLYGDAWVEVRRTIKARWIIASR